MRVRRQLGEHAPLLDRGPQRHHHRRVPGVRVQHADRCRRHDPAHRRRMGSRWPFAEELDLRGVGRQHELDGARCPLRRVRMGGEPGPRLQLSEQDGLQVLQVLLHRPQQHVRRRLDRAVRNPVLRRFRVRPHLARHRRGRGLVAGLHLGQLPVPRRLCVRQREERQQQPVDCFAG